MKEKDQELLSRILDEDVSEFEDMEEVEQSASEPAIAVAEPTPAPTPNIAISEELLDAVAGDIAQRVAAK